MNPLLKGLLRYGLPTVGNAALWDSVMHGGGVPFTGDWDTSRGVMTGLNAAIGAGSGMFFGARKGLGKARIGSEPVKGITTLALTPTKDLIVKGVETMPSLAKYLEGGAAASKAETAKALDSIRASGRNSLIAGALGLGALGIGGAALYKYLKSKPNQDEGKIRLKLPGKKGDPSTEAEVEVPIGQIPMSPNLQEGLFRNVRLQARRNVRANSKKRDPETGKLISMDEFDAKYGNQSPYAASNLNKAASSVLPALIGATVGGGLTAQFGKEHPYLSVGGGALAGALLAAVVNKLKKEEPKQVQTPVNYNDDSDIDME